MKIYCHTLLPALILAIAALACNMPSGIATETPTENPVKETEAPAELSPEDIAATYVAQTATAQAAAATEEPTTVTVTVSLATNCRTGPDTAYQLLMLVQPGTKFEVVGKYSPKSYWIITMPGGGTCWLWGQYATITGDTNKLPEMAAPALPVAQNSNSDSNNSNDSDNSNNSNNSNDSDSGDSNSNNSNSNNSQPTLPPPPLPPTPAAPTNIDITRQCTNITQSGDLFPTYKMFVTLTWTDSSNNETGFSIFKDGILVSTLSANTQQFNETFVVLLPSSTTVTYGVQAVGPTGASATVTGTVKYCGQ